MPQPGGPQRMVMSFMALARLREDHRPASPESGRGGWSQLRFRDAARASTCSRDTEEPLPCRAGVPARCLTRA